jgi:hypothetical protein
MDLKWRTEICCEKTEKDQLRGYWQDIKEVLKEVLQRNLETLED